VAAATAPAAVSGNGQAPAAGQRGGQS